MGRHGTIAGRKAAQDSKRAAMFTKYTSCLLYTSRTGMVFIPSGRADRYSVFHHSAEIRVQEGDKASRYNKRGHALRVSGIKVDDIFSIVFSES